MTRHPIPPQVVGHHRAGVIKIMFRSAQTAGAISMIETVTAPGDGLRWHKHSREDELLYIVSGVAEIQIRDIVYHCEAGDRVLGPCNIFHTYRNVGDTDLKMVIAYAPGGFEQSFVDVAQMVERGYHDDEIDEMLAERYGLVRGRWPTWE